MRAGQHRDRQLGDHRHVDRDPVAGRDAELLEGVGRLADLALEVAEGQRPGVAGLADPVVRDLVAETALDVAVDAVVADVELTADEPLGERQLPFQGRLERLRPVESLARALRPEGLEVALGLLVEVGLGVGLGHEGEIRREGPGLGKQILDLGRRGGRLDAQGETLAFDIGWPGHPTAQARGARPPHPSENRAGQRYSVPSARSS